MHTPGDTFRITLPLLTKWWWLWDLGRSKFDLLYVSQGRSLLQHPHGFKPLPWVRRTLQWLRECLALGKACTWKWSLCCRKATKRSHCGTRWWIPQWQVKCCHWLFGISSLAVLWAALWHKVGFGTKQAEGTKTFFLFVLLLFAVCFIFPLKHSETQWK